MVYTCLIVKRDPVPSQPYALMDSPSVPHARVVGRFCCFQHG